VREPWLRRNDLRAGREAFGAGMALYFAAQGVGKMAWPLAAAIARLAIVALGGAAWHGSLGGLFWIVASSYLAFGGINILATASGASWGRRPALAAS
jgi:hypothetical protein